MRRMSWIWIAAFGAAVLVGCREPMDFGRTLTADPARGLRLYTANCANTCHPDNAFQIKSVTSYEELAYTVRDYYEQVVGKDANYSQQDIFDITRYLNDKHYRFKRPAL